MRGQCVERVGEAKYLGPILNEFFGWITQYTLLTNKLSQSSFKVRHYSCQYLKKTISYYLFSSHLIYRSQLWAQYQETEFKK